MSRGLSPAQALSQRQPHRVVVPLVELLFDSGTLRLALGKFDVPGPDNTTYIATGPLAFVKAAREAGKSLEGLAVGMSGLDAAIVTLATSEPYRGRALRLIKAYLNPDTNEPVGEPKVWWPGRMVNMVIEEQNDSATITIFAEHYDVELSRPAPLRWSDADQQRLYPGDLGCQYSAEVSEKTVLFPSKEAQRR